MDIYDLKFVEQECLWAYNLKLILSEVRLNQLIPKLQLYLNYINAFLTSKKSFPLFKVVKIIDSAEKIFSE